MKKHSQAKACRGILNTKYWWILILLIVLTLGITSFFASKDKTSTTVTIKNKTFRVELAQTEAQREQGLMNRDHLDANSGMLFVYPDSDIHSFWMKDTLIPLDVIWINDGKIVDIQTLDIPSEDNIPSYTPKLTADKVLEINAGISQENNFQIGDEVKINQ